MTDSSNLPSEAASTDADPVVEPAHLVAAAPVLPESPAFSDFDIRPEIVAALADAGIIKTFAIQELTLPIALAGSDLIGQARTGTGKTLGFGVPLLNRITLPSAPGRRPGTRRGRRPANWPSRSPSDLAAAGAKLGARCYDLRRTRLRTAGRGAAQRRRRRRRHARSAARPGPAGPPRPRCRAGRSSWTRPTRCSTSASCPTSSGSVETGAGASARRCCSRRPCPARSSALARTFLNQPVQIRAEHAARTPHGTDHIDQFAYRAHALDKVEMLARILQVARPRPDDDLRPNQAHRAEGRRRSRGARFRRRRRARRPRPGCPRAGAARVPHRQGRRPRRHRRRGARPGRRGDHPRHQLPGARGRDELRAPHRPHRPCRGFGHRGHASSTGTICRAGS